jgi:sterol desaturase/sphingolipid hydroxylase (fatty acid hydroxylase superfamily)
MYGLIEKYSIGILLLFKIPIIIKIILGFLLIDLWIYFWHFINHNSRFLWKFHRAHHSDLKMDSTTAIRFHTGEILISSLLKIPIFFIIGVTPEIVIIHEIVLNISTIFHHSNVNLPESIDKILRIIIVTPNMHRVHHSQIMKETNSNYTSTFSFWDRLFKTFKMNNNTSSIELGLKEFVNDKWQNLWGIIITPFIKV